MSARQGIDNAIAAFRSGEMVLIIDDFDRENEGDLVIAAEHTTAAAINFMTVHGRGLVCVAIDESFAQQKGLEPMVRRNEDDFGTAFTVSVDAAPVHGVTTGISAQDRATTVRTIIDPTLGATSLRRPGHMFPLIANPMGVLARRGHTEASTDLCELAGLQRAAVIVEVLREDGSMAREPELAAFATEHDIVVITVADVVRKREQLAGIHEEAVVAG
jgi:3,4-dihydroxy-2-butanone 4-phosphate synthase